MMLAKRFDPCDIERPCYEKWEQAGYFKPSMQSHAPTFCIQLPPPNVTGTLHMGHAFNQTIMDSLVRYHRMCGDNTLWLPGTDHAGIATQIVVERQLSTAGLSRQQLGRAAFIDKVWEWKKTSGATMTQQMRRLGCSLDWSREYFTLDSSRAQAVTEAFVRLYQQGLIYRGKRLVNWDPKLNTAVSDLEVDSFEKQGQLYFIRYPVLDSSDALIVATTRPETLLGDVAVAVHPQDERYQRLIGKAVHLPLTGRRIPIIADEYVEASFGTGCVKITPAHDFNDYQVGKRHHTVLINILQLNATLRDQAEVWTYDGLRVDDIALPHAYAGLDRSDARAALLNDLQQQGFLVEAKPHTLMEPRGERTGSVIEPMLTDQWFVATTRPALGDPTGKTLAQKALDAVEGGEVRFVPEQWINTYRQWMDGIEDWCISRQLWWGHPIPAWYDAQGQLYVAHSEEEARQMANDKPLTRDSDVLDTWFSSALLPFSALGWPQKTPELAVFLPSTVLVTGYEILFFWVARMIMLSTHFLGRAPFKDVYIHGIVRDHEGKKMSKSEGNVIDPVDLISGIDLESLIAKRTTGLRQPEKAPHIVATTKALFPQGIPAYGSDALRLTMASYASLGRAVNFDFKRCEGYRNFCNKLYNATRFVLMHVAQGHDPKEPGTPSFAERWIMSRLQQAIQEISTAFDTYRCDLAAQAVYELIWNEYCDWYLELAKVSLAQGDEAQKQATRHTLLTVLESALRLVHPLAPFISEELWQSLVPLIQKDHAASVMLAAWPTADHIQIDTHALQWMAEFKEWVNTVRHLRGEMGLSPAQTVPLLIAGSEAPHLLAFLPSFKALAKLSAIHFVETLPEDDAPRALIAQRQCMLQVPLDVQAQKKRLIKEHAQASAKRDGLVAKLAMPGYLTKAPAHLVEHDQAQLLEVEEKLKNLTQWLGL